MQLAHLAAFVAVAEELHFGRAAQKLGVLPASLGRHIRLLEADLGLQLFARTTRSVMLTPEGEGFLAEVMPMLGALEDLGSRMRSAGRLQNAVLRIGAIDSAAQGIMPFVIADHRELDAQIALHLTEDKGVRLLPKLLSGRLDLAILRPPAQLQPQFASLPLFYETAVLAVAASHPRAGAAQIGIEELHDMPLIVPERRSRPHSHQLSFSILGQLGQAPRIAQIADEKQTIIGLVAAGIGAAIVPRAAQGRGRAGVVFLPITGLSLENQRLMALSLVWLRDVRDDTRDRLIAMIMKKRDDYAALC